MDLKTEAKKEVLRSLISKMHMMMSEPADMEAHEKAIDPNEPGDSDPMALAKHEAGEPPEFEAKESVGEPKESLDPEAVKGFMKKTNKNPIGKHSMLIASMGVAAKSAPKGKPFQKKSAY